MVSIVTVNKNRDKRIIPEYHKAASLFPVLAYSPDDHLFYCEDQSMGFSFVCEPMNGADDKIHKRLIGFLNQEFPDDTNMQFMLFRSPDINRDLDEIVDIRRAHNDPFLSQVVRERVKFLKKHSRERIIANNFRGQYDNGVIHDLKLFVSVKIPIASARPSEEEMLRIRHTRGNVFSGLQSLNVHPLPVDANGYIRIMSTLLNWGDDATWRDRTRSPWDENETIAEQVLDFDTDVNVGKDWLTVGDHHVQMLSAKHMAEVMFFGDALSYIGDLSGGSSGIKENYAIITNINFPNAQKYKSKMETKRQAIVNQAYGPMLKFVPILADKKNSFDLLYESMNKGNRAIQMSYHMMIFAPTKERVEAAANQAVNIWREQGFSLMKDKFVLLPVFLNCLPLCTDRKVIKDLFRYKTMTTEQSSVLLPLFGEWKGTGTAHAALLSRNGQLMSLSLHDSDTNKNLLIAAESGSGKSFLANELIFSYLSEGAQVWIIDVGRSYEKLCELLEGDFVHFGDDTDICLNPFTRIPNDLYDEEEDSLVALICSMASFSGQLNDWQVSELKREMRTLWEKHGNKMTIDHISDACRTSNDGRLSDIGDQLNSFTSRGAYGRFFAGESNTQFNSRFTVLELDDLQGRKHLRQVVLLQLIFQIQQEVFLGERNRKKILLIDEAWQLLNEGEVAVFIEHAYRKFRKYGGSVAIATQSINDLYQSKTGQAIAENSSSMYLLGQTEETVESVKRSGRLTLSEGGYHTLRSVHTVIGVYSEIFIKSKTGTGVGRLIVGDFQKLLYSTSPEDVNAIGNYVKQGLIVPDAINQVLADRKNIM